MAKTAIEKLPPDLREYVEESLRASVSTTVIIQRLATEGHKVTRRQLQTHQDKHLLKGLERPVAVLKAVGRGKLALSSDDALLAVLGDALEQLDRLGALVRSHHNSRLERILADSYPAVFSMLKEVSFNAGELQRVRGLEDRQEAE